MSVRLAIMTCVVISMGLFSQVSSANPINGGVEAPTPDVFSNYYIMIAFSLVLFIGFRKSIPRFVGIGLTIAFVTYLVSLLLNFF